MPWIWQKMHTYLNVSVSLIFRIVNEKNQIRRFIGWIMVCSMPIAHNTGKIRDYSWKMPCFWNCTADLETFIIKASSIIQMVRSSAILSFMLKALQRYLFKYHGQSLTQLPVKGS